MRCRNGQEHTHETAAQSKACWLGGHADTTATLAQPVAMDRGMSGDDYEAMLASGHVATDTPSNVANRMARTLEANLATRVQVANGRYAVTLAGEDKIRFFRVKNGHKPGVTFVDEQASDDLWPVKSPARRAAILATIAADPTALAGYGQELGVCGRCGRTLTDEASRAAGMGLTCRSK